MASDLRKLACLGPERVPNLRNVCVELVYHKPSAEELMELKRFLKTQSNIIRRSAENRANRLEEEAVELREKYETLMRTLENERVKFQQKLDDERQARQDTGRIASDLRVKIAQTEAEANKSVAGSQKEVTRLQRMIDQLEMALSAERAKHKVVA
jgi:hypothetical protein